MAQALLKTAPTQQKVPQTALCPKVLAVSGLGKSYGTQTRVLHEINFDLHCGELVAVIGRSGAGKSTLLQMLDVTTPASEGEILNFRDNGQQ